MRKFSDEQIIGKFCLLGLLLFSSILVMSGVCAGADSNEYNPDGKPIDSIEIKNGDIFDLDQSGKNHWFFRLANKFHIKTKKHVIKRELLQGENQLFSVKLAHESERNLRALPFIWDAKIEIIEAEDGVNVMSVTTSDRWTLAGGPTISRSSGQLTYQFGFDELNFLGYGQRLSFDYFLREFEEDFVRASFYERRLFGSRLGLNIYHNGNPEVGLSSVGLSKPLYSLNSKYGYGINYLDVDRVDKYYRSGVEVARNRFAGSEMELSAVYRFGSYEKKLSTSLVYSYRDIRVFDRQIAPHTVIVFPEDSIYSAITGSLKAGTYRYITTRRINGITRSEDFLTGSEISISNGLAFDAISRNRIYRTMAFSAVISGYSDSNLISMALGQTYWISNGNSFRKRTNISISYYNNRLSWLTPAVMILYVEDWRRDGLDALYLGENNGLRGFPRYYSEGERFYRVNVENRFFTGLKILSNELGVTQFLDLGRIWGGDEKFEIRHNLWSVGVGLRIGTERVSNADMIRIDVAYAGNIKRWQLSFGIGQYL